MAAINPAVSTPSAKLRAPHPPAMQSMIIVTNGCLLLSRPEAITVVQEPTQPASSLSCNSGTLDSIFAMHTFDAFVADQVPLIEPIETPWGNSALTIVPTGVTYSSADEPPERPRDVVAEQR